VVTCISYTSIVCIKTSDFHQIVEEKRGKGGKGKKRSKCRIEDKENGGINLKIIEEYETMKWNGNETEWNMRKVGTGK
jgi:hypothetical protein